MSEFVIGMKELSKKLAELDEKVARRALASAANRAATPVVSAMRAAVPRGSLDHKTYKGRYAAPGFASRNIAKSVKFDKTKGTATVNIGVRKEAFYIVQFYDERKGRTPYRITTRRVKGKGKVAIKPYTLQAKPWFSSVFINSQEKMLSTLREILQQNIEKVTRGT